MGNFQGDLIDGYHLDVPIVRVSCDYCRPLVPSQVIQVRVWVEKPGRSSITLIVDGESGGKIYFRARIVSCFVERGNFSSRPIPEKFRQQIKDYRDQCGDVAADLTTVNREDFPPERIAVGLATEDAGRYCLPSGVVPFTCQRRVLDGDCVASGVIYAPRVVDYAVEAIEEWYEEIPGISWMELVCNRQQGAPFVSVSCDYLRPLVPRQSITVEVWVAKLGGASIEFVVFGYDDNDIMCFDARLTACFIDLNDFKAMRIPEVFRQRILAFLPDGEPLKEGKTERRCKLV